MQYTPKYREIKEYNHLPKFKIGEDFCYVAKFKVDDILPEFQKEFPDRWFIKYELKPIGYPYNPKKPDFFQFPQNICIARRWIFGKTANDKNDIYENSWVTGVLIDNCKVSHKILYDPINGKYNIQVSTGFEYPLIDYMIDEYIDNGFIVNKFESGFIKFLYLYFKETKNIDISNDNDKNLMLKISSLETENKLLKEKNSKIISLETENKLLFEKIEFLEEKIDKIFEAFKSN